MITQNKTTQAAMTPEIALNILKEGNKRFVKNAKYDRDHIEQVHTTSEGQFPIGVVLSCLDSRIPTELIFDQGIGDVFVARVAGNIVNEDILGSMEFACKLSEAKLIVVLGHTACGAIKGACDHAELGNLTGLLSKIKPAVKETPSKPGSERNSSNLEFVNNVAIRNVELNMQSIIEKSQVLNDMANSDQINIVGAMYQVETGKVEFLN